MAKYILTDWKGCDEDDEPHVHIFRNKDAERLQEENTWELNIQQHIDVFNSVL